MKQSIRFSTHLLKIFLPWLLITNGLHAQVINGTILDGDTNEPLIGVNVSVKDSNIGTTTDVDGSFTLPDISSKDILSFTYLGYNTVEMLASSGTDMTVLMFASAFELSEVAVTALGIERETKALGYGIQEISGNQLTQAREPNLINSLSGRMAGVNIIQGGSGVGSSARIVIRGESSLSGNNQPLFVVNGTPISNATGSNGRQQGNLEADYGNGAAEVNPDDIETITVLKGANATALYGSRAANGVILITTKTGQDTKGLGVSFNSSTTLETPLRVPKYQNKYGQGAGFNFEFVDGFGSGTNDNIDESWGPALDGRMMVMHHSTGPEGIRAGDFLRRPSDYSDQTQYEELPWSPQPENINDFFETGLTTSNNIAIYGGDKNRNFRLSYTNLNSDGILPNTNLKRNNIGFDASQRFLNDRLTINANLNYINSSSDNRANNSYGTENIMYLWVWFGRHIPMSSLESYWQKGFENVQQFNYNYNWHDNPYFTLYENTNAFNKDRIFGNINATYQLTDELSLLLRTGTDLFNDLRVGKRAWSSQRFPQGQYREDKVFFQERNSDFLLQYNKPDLSRVLSLQASIGGNQMTQTNRYHMTAANELAIPGIYNFNNSAIALANDQFNSKERINSLYGAISLGYNNSIYLDLAARNDWASTLPAENRSYFYPSASVSIIASEFLDLPSTTFLKFRAGWGQVGNDTDPYSLQSYFDFLTTPYGTQLLGTESNTLANANLLPERASTFELGADLRFIDGRIGVDLSYYNTNTINQILQIPISQASGFGSVFINAGKINSQGIEALVRLNPIRKTNFRWDVDLNFTRARSQVKELAEGLETYQIASNYLQVLAKVGGRMGDVYGTGFVMIDPATNQQLEISDIEEIKDDYAVLYNADNGQPVRDPNLRKLGNYNPDFSLGMYNSIRYKNLSLGFLLDWRQGGVVKSRTLLIGGTSGMMEETAQLDRETTTFIGGQTRIEGVKELDRPGVKAVVTGDQTTYVTNDVPMSARDFFWSHFNRGNEQVGMYDASFLKLREVKIGYKLPSNIAQKVRAQSLSISLVGRNLLLWTENPHFDPEVFSFNGNNQVPGVEDMATPSTRSFGINLNAQF
ncbi:MAG: SusC/RagA family TonB-linked outer membrane protein [Saprospiraceae bacterium]|nr:SusC/RagA family TonB-linked outer membrane protein [Saprospiraceae bacterium]